MQPEKVSRPKALPLQQAKLLRYIGEFRSTHGFSPSPAFMRQHLGVKNLRGYSEPLVKKGYIQRVVMGLAAQPSGFEPTMKGWDWLEAVKDQAALTYRSHLVQFRRDRRRDSDRDLQLKLPIVVPRPRDAAQTRIVLRRGGTS